MTGGRSRALVALVWICVVTLGLTAAVAVSADDSSADGVSGDVDLADRVDELVELQSLSDSTIVHIVGGLGAGLAIGIGVGATGTYLLKRRELEDRFS